VVLKTAASSIFHVGKTAANDYAHRRTSKSHISNRILKKLDCNREQVHAQNSPKTFKWTTSWLDFLYFCSHDLYSLVECRQSLLSSTALHATLLPSASHKVEKRPVISRNVCSVFPKMFSHYPNTKLVNPLVASLRARSDSINQVFVTCTLHVLLIEQRRAQVGTFKIYCW